MGSIARMNQAERFIAQFGDLLNESLKIEGEIKIVGQGVGYDDVHCEVRHYLRLEIGGQEHEVDTGQFVFASDCSEFDDTVEGLELCLDLPREEIESRLTSEVDGSSIFPAKLKETT